jgi:hypothetical protein
MGQLKKVSLEGDTDRGAGGGVTNGDVTACFEASDRKQDQIRSCPSNTNTNSSLNLHTYAKCF